MTHASDFVFDILPLEKLQPSATNSWSWMAISGDGIKHCVKTTSEVYLLGEVLESTQGVTLWLKAAGDPA